MGLPLPCHNQARAGGRGALGEATFLSRSLLCPWESFPGVLGLECEILITLRGRWFWCVYFSPKNGTVAVEYFCEGKQPPSLSEDKTFQIKPIISPSLHLSPPVSSWYRRKGNSSTAFAADFTEGRCSPWSVGENFPSLCAPAGHGCQQYILKGNKDSRVALGAHHAIQFSGLELDCQEDQALSVGA
jgi:hypothetical protein